MPKAIDDEAQELRERVERLERALVTLAAGVEWTRFRAAEQRSTIDPDALPAIRRDMDAARDRDTRAGRVVALRSELAGLGDAA